MNDDYTLQTSTISHCANCKTHVDLLMTDDEKSPIFFICWTCHKISIAGKGEVPILK